MTPRPVLTCCVCGQRRAAPDGVKAYKRPRVLALHDPDQRYRQGWRFEEVRPAVQLESQPVEESRIAKAT